MASIQFRRGPHKVRGNACLPEPRQAPGRIVNTAHRWNTAWAMSPAGLLPQSAVGDVVAEGQTLALIEAPGKRTISPELPWPKDRLQGRARRMFKAPPGPVVKRKSQSQRLELLRSSPWSDRSSKCFSPVQCSIFQVRSVLLRPQSDLSDGAGARFLTSLLPSWTRNTPAPQLTQGESSLADSQAQGKTSWVRSVPQSVRNPFSSRNVYVLPKVQGEG